MPTAAAFLMRQKKRRLPRGARQAALDDDL